MSDYYWVCSTWPWVMDDQGMTATISSRGVGPGPLCSEAGTDSTRGSHSGVVVAYDYPPEIMYTRI